ncbi:MAG: hypothetical protein M3256_04535 [Actinomycetota bacterium]|nr:hypothetical protein [Actinomycetota bacterium]
MTLVRDVVLTSIGYVFLLAALGKIRHPLMFAMAIRNYQILPDSIASLVAIVFIGIESFLAVAFLTRSLTRLAIPLAALTLVSFATAVGMNLRRKRPVACGCFGGDKEPISGRSMARLLLLLLGVSYIWIVTANAGGFNAIPPIGARHVRYDLEVATSAVALTLLGMWHLSIPELRSSITFGLRRIAPKESAL